MQPTHPVMMLALAAVLVQTVSAFQPSMSIPRRTWSHRTAGTHDAEAMARRLGRETVKWTPDPVFIEEIAGELRRAQAAKFGLSFDHRGSVQGSLWSVVWPRTPDNTTLVWRISAAGYDGFMQGTPERTREAVIASLGAARKDFHRLTLLHVECSAPEAGEPPVGWVGRLGRWMGRWTARRGTQPRGLDFASCLVDTGVYCNPLLANSYHIPHKPVYGSPETPHPFTIRDNNIMYADDSILVMENQWVHRGTDDVYRLPVMVCKRLWR